MPYSPSEADVLPKDNRMMKDTVHFHAVIDRATYAKIQSEKALTNLTSAEWLKYVAVKIEQKREKNK